MDKFLIKNKKLNWEFMLDNYIKQIYFFVLKIKFFWTNVNFKKTIYQLKINEKKIKKFILHCL